MTIDKDSIFYDEEHKEYKVIERVDNGVGGFAEVYKAKGYDGKLYAIKVIKDSIAKSGSKISSMLRNEAEAMKILDDNVVRYMYYHDGSEHRGYPPYLIMIFP